jgi:hypothetical protein
LQWAGFPRFVLIPKQMGEIRRLIQVVIFCGFRAVFRQDDTTIPLDVVGLSEEGGRRGPPSSFI